MLFAGNRGESQPHMPPRLNLPNQLHSNENGNNNTFNIQTSGINIEDLRTNHIISSQINIEINKDVLSTMLKRELVELCKFKTLKSTGNKADLIARLVEYSKNNNVTNN